MIADVSTEIGGSGSTSSSMAVEEWIPAPDHTATDIGKFKEALYKDFEAVCTKHRGPVQFLKDLYPDRESRLLFLNSVLDLFPYSDIVMYHTEKDIPEIREDEKSSKTSQVLHISCFAWEGKVSIKRGPGKKLACDIAGRVLNEGFVTSGEPLLITCAVEGIQHDNPAKLNAQSIGYSKGFARMSTLLALIALMIKDGMTAEALKLVPRLGRSGHCKRCKLGAATVVFFFLTTRGPRFQNKNVQLLFCL